MAQVIVPAIASAVGAGATGTAFIGLAVNLGLSAVASYAIQALSPKPKIPGSGGFLVNDVNPTAPAEYVYGEVRKGGIVTYDEATDGNAILHRIIVLATCSTSSPTIGPSSPHCTTTERELTESELSR